MRNLSIILLFVLILTAKSQDRPPSPFTFTYRANDTMRVNEPLKKEYFKQNNFWLGTQWYGHPRMLQALNMQGNHGTWPDSKMRMIKNPDSSYRMYHIWEKKGFDYALGFEYKPTLYIPESDRGKLISDVNDPSRPIFGFSHRDGTVEPPIDSGDVNYRLGLYPNDLNSYSHDSVVLKKAWINNQHKLVIKPGDKGHDPDLHGINWIFSINLRRLDLNENANPEDTILTIRLPYLLHKNCLAIFM